MELMEYQARVEEEKNHRKEKRPPDILIESSVSGTTIHKERHNDLQKNKHESDLTTGANTARSFGNEIESNRLINRIETQAVSSDFQLHELDIDFDKDFEALSEELWEDIQMLGEIRVQESTGLLLFADFCRINTLIKKYTHPANVPSLKTLIDYRRA